MEVWSSGEIPTLGKSMSESSTRKCWLKLWERTSFPRRVSRLEMRRALRTTPPGALTCKSGAKKDESVRETQGQSAGSPLENGEAPSEANSGQGWGMRISTTISEAATEAEDRDEYPEVKGHRPREDDLCWGGVLF